MGPGSAIRRQENQRRCFTDMYLIPKKDHRADRFELACSIAGDTEMV